MVAGATGIDLFLMTIAADDGVMPQTREHAAVLRALADRSRRRGGDQGRPRRPRGRDRARRRTLLPGATAVVAVSARTGIRARDRCSPRSTRSPPAPAAGPTQPAAAAAHRSRVHDPRRRHGRHRDAVVGRDRARGRAARCCRIGRAARVRGVQVHDQAVERADAGQRVAVNLVGRGAERARPGRRARLAAGRPAPDLSCSTWPRARAAERERGPELEHGDRVQVHHGTREGPARLAWLGGRFWQLRLEQPLVADRRGPARRAADRTAGHARGRRRSSTLDRASTARAASCSPGSARLARGEPDETVDDPAQQRPAGRPGAARAPRPGRPLRRSPRTRSRSSSGCAPRASSRRSTAELDPDALAALRAARARGAGLARRCTTTPTHSPTIRGG